MEIGLFRGRGELCKGLVDGRFLPFLQSCSPLLAMIRVVEQEW